MKKKKIEGIKDRKVILPAIIMALGGILMFLEILNIDNQLKEAVHWIADPVVILSENGSRSVADYFSVLIDIPKVEKELNDLNVEKFEYESKVAYVSILEEENQSLREELNLGNMEHKYVEAKMLGQVQDNVIRVNAGKNQGIKIGDTVSLGYNLIGTVMDTSQNISSIRLPYSKSSTLEVWVASATDKKKILSRAVVKGTGEEYMIIENISKEANVKEGDYVIVNDERIVDTLVLGQISELNLDPAKTSISGKVVSIVTFDTLISVFICTQW